MEKETKHTPDALWEKMAREDWLAGEGFSGKFDGLSRVPHIFKPRIFEFAESYSASLQTELSEMKKEREELRESLKKIFGYMDSGVLIRDISKDHEPGWAIKMLPFQMDLKEAYDLINKTTNG